ncbi:MAG: peptide chain release factor N(5)-glutamine methyltransferase [Anaerolineae bacterium]|jgi:release factor glutamine methyltransferase|nr:peptide chain release factor N(5)-glutamine methyltransferase [Anaerolineae bacterium]MBT7073301.1 peptide chain release factor N(5)-glutamine methyltransferase [Anaerolineae bacterium]MBT7781430.1 peptide chain release factor N(5)-glutamine methyltransferase [Anaerolineae bacterium]
MSPILPKITRNLQKSSETPALDAQVLLAHITGKSRAWLLAHPELKLSLSEEKKLNSALEKLQNNIPLPYVIGHWEFFGLEFHLSNAVLIPRPETEELIEHALSWLRASNARHVLDMGTGSGCIPISLARNIRDLNVVAVDISSSALNIARQNAQKHEVEITFAQSDLLANLPLATFDLITANLPYIPTKTLKTLEVFQREPTLALDGGESGLDLIQRLLKDAPRYLAPKGVIMLEIDSSHGAAALELAKKFFPEAENKLVKDLSKRDRFIIIQT